MNSHLAASFARCRQIARGAGTNFYYSFLLLPRDQRRAMCALYAFLRLTDDLGDSEAPAGAASTGVERQVALERWRASLDRTLEGYFDHPILPAVADTVARYAIPLEYLHGVIDGVASDLQEPAFRTFAELEAYCYQVAGVVGLACLHIWGFSDTAAFGPARCCGLAFQLTNILRDIEEDLRRGRIYLPREDLERFSYSEDDLRSRACDTRFRQLMRFEVARVETCYEEAASLIDYLQGGGRAMFGAMFDTYRALLTEVKYRDGNVFGRRIRLSSWRKMRIVAHWLMARPAATRSLQTAART